MRSETGNLIKEMGEKLVEDPTVIDLEDLVSQICDVTEWKQDSEVFKFLGLSQ